MGEHLYTRENMATELSVTFDLGLDITRPIADWLFDDYTETIGIMDELKRVEAAAKRYIVDGDMGAWLFLAARFDRLKQERE